VNRTSGGSALNMSLGTAVAGNIRGSDNHGHRPRPLTQSQLQRREEGHCVEVTVLPENRIAVRNSDRLDGGAECSLDRKCRLDQGAQAGEFNDLALRAAHVPVHRAAAPSQSCNAIYQATMTCTSGESHTSLHTCGSGQGTPCRHHVFNVPTAFVPT